MAPFKWELQVEEPRWRIVLSGGLLDSYETFEGGDLRGGTLRTADESLLASFLASALDSYVDWLRRGKPLSNDGYYEGGWCPQECLDDLIANGVTADDIRLAFDGCDE